MNNQKIVRTVCAFTNNPSNETVARLNALVATLENNGYMVQTKRVCSTLQNLPSLLELARNGIEYISVGAISLLEAQNVLPEFYNNKALTCNIELANEEIGLEHVALLQNVIQSNASKTFNFTYTFKNAASSPYFPSARYETDGFAIGLQPTDLSEGCTSLQEWLEKLKTTWQELADLFATEPDFLGIDSSIAPLLEGSSSSFVNFVKRLGITFEQSVTTNMYTTITKFIKEQNPKPVGLCGMMLPCTEDFELTAEYEQGNFSIERNIFLSLHSGLGIDTYPIGVNEAPERVLQVLKLMQALSNKYAKPLSVRFVSDGKANVGEQTDFQNQYLQDCIVRAL